MSNEEIKTQSIASGVAKTIPVLLDKTSETIIQFNPILHSEGVSGSIVKFKKDKKSDWKKLKSSDFKNHALLAMEKISIPISTETLKKLTNEVISRENIVKNGIKYGSHEYITVEKNKVIIITEDNKKQLLEQILKKGYSNEFWSLISDSDPELADKLSAGHLQSQRKKVLYELKERLKKAFPETKGPDSWQNWIYGNNWLFGFNYQGSIEKQKINISGVMPDYLFQTVDGFIDILEIKLPDDEVILIDNDHKGSWKWTSETNSAIGQVVNYLSEIDRLKLEIEKNIKTEYKREVSLLKPRAFILIGNSESWDVVKKEALRKLNHSLHGIEVITYFDLIQRGETFTNLSLLKTKEEDKNDDISF